MLSSKNQQSKNKVSRARFKKHEAVGLVDPNSLNENATMKYARSSYQLAQQNIASARVLNPENH